MTDESKPSRMNFWELSAAQLQQISLAVHTAQHHTYSVPWMNVSNHGTENDFMPLALS